jgi:hypothetical protein
MQTKKFTELLGEENIEYKIDGGKIIITGERDVYSLSLESLPKGTKFNNNGDAYLDSIESLPEGTKFNNGGNVHLLSLKSLPEDTKFNNGRDVYLNSLKSLPEGMEFNNGGGVDLYSLESLPKGTKFNNGEYVSLRSLKSLPKGTKFNNGGRVYLKHKTIKYSKPYLERHKVKIEDGSVVLYKKVSKDLKTQEDTENETLWEIGTTLTHDNWKPGRDECGEGKFHACARAHWCDGFRIWNSDKYVAIEVKVGGLYEWPDEQEYPQKIAFRKGKVLYECDRDGNDLTGESNVVLSRLKRFFRRENKK